ncbi:MAG TPA: HAD family phosphatase [Bacteroidia bacterium]|jgi:putative hydrolase of the HAD superfamily
MEAQISQVRNIIFDLGGVLLNLDFGLTEKAFLDLGLPDLNAIYSHAQQTGLFDDFEKGNISPGEFRMQMKKFIGLNVSDEAIDSAWNAMLLDLPLGRVEVLQRVKKTHRIFLLSNTNEIHYSAYSGYLKKAHGFPDLSHIFEREYLSYKMGMRKPDAEIFERVLEENKLRKEETLFIDDTIRHIEGARRVGIHALHLEKGKTILDIFP